MKDEILQAQQGAFHLPMRYVLRLLEDMLPASIEPVFLPRALRVLYVQAGNVMLETPSESLRVGSDSAWFGDDTVTYVAGKDGATLLRWELVSTGVAAAHDGRLRTSPKSASTVKLSAELELDPDFAWLMRCDAVSFPKGGEALLHVHQGPGIRCTTRGELLIDSEGHQHSYSAGQAWFENGHTPVYARAGEMQEMTFVRCMLLPRSLKGRSSVRYVRREDDDRPKSQSYVVYGERFIELPD